MTMNGRPDGRRPGQPPPLPRRAGPLGEVHSAVDEVVSKVRAAVDDVRRKMAEEFHHERSCPRPGCAELNPLNARFCRRCGVTLGGGHA